MKTTINNIITVGKISKEQRRKEDRQAAEDW